MDSSAKTNAGIAAVLSFIFSGLGQIYNGQIKKGLVIMSFSSLGLISALLGAILIGYYIFGKVFFANELIVGLSLLIFGIILIALLGTYSIFNAYKRAQEK